MSDWKKRKKNYHNSGITLLALIITIIVLLILAGVSINLVTGDNGVLTEAQLAKRRTEYETVAEALRLKVLNKFFDFSLDSQYYTEYLIEEGITDHGGKVNLKALGLNLSTGNGKWNADGNGNGGDIYQVVGDDLYYIIKIENHKTTEREKAAVLWEKVWLAFNEDGYITARTGNLSYTDIIIPEEVSQKTIVGIYHDAFKDTNITSVRIDAPIVEIQEKAFKRCTNLKSINLPNTLTTIGDEAFRECTSLTTITIPASVTSIGASAFYGCTNLRTIIIEAPITSIGEKTFKSCTSLSTITIPNTVTSIGAEAFHSCSSLNHIVIPSSVVSIGDEAFKHTVSLTDLIIQGTPTLGIDAFTDCPGH